MKHWQMSSHAATGCGIPYCMWHSGIDPVVIVSEIRDIECQMCRHVAGFDVELEKDRAHFSRCEALLGIPGRKNVRTLDDVRAGIEAAARGAGEVRQSVTVHLQHPNKAASMCAKPFVSLHPGELTRDVAQADCPECALLRPYVEYIQELHEFVDLMTERFLPVTKGLPRTYREKCESVCAALDGHTK